MAANMQVCVIVGVIALFSFIQMGTAIRCYVCSSDGDDDCLDKFKKEQFPQLDCSQQYINRPFQPNACQKTIESINGKSHVVRSCAFQSTLVAPGKCEPPIHSNTIKVDFCELCSTDGCNSAPQSLPKSVYTHALAFGAAVLIGRFIAF